MSSSQPEPWVSLKDIKKNFAEANPGLKQKEAVEEANRCLYCYDAPCITACPTGIDIPTFIKGIATDNLKGSARTIMESNPVGASCSRVCPTEELCEGACVLNDASSPIMIGDLQRYATDWAIKNEQQLFQREKHTSSSVAIIGGGPAGLSAARELARFGHEVTIFEAEEKAGGLNAHGIVSFRLPKDIVEWEVQQVKQLGVRIKTGVEVGKDIDAHLIMEMFDAVILAIGMANVPKLGIKGEELNGVYDAIDFVKETKTRPLTKHLAGKRVAVIGAGNTAIDAATCSVRLGAENVKIVYRRTQKEMTAYPFEFEFAKQDGVEFQWLSSPSEITAGKDGNVNGLKVKPMKLIQSMNDKRMAPVPIEGAEDTLDVDIVIRAIGQSRHSSLIEAFSIDHDNGVITVDPETLATSKENVYAIGDSIFGKGQGEAMVVSAAEQGKQAAVSVHKALTEKNVHLA
ncbi:NAD(P)-dependent oxidoreductase [Alteribacillus sp. YIM 98480]|uniref:NAD(P)-dependent oxidoreductase n=1 Tax=Alteribacillus sp. YIM 98480 TaxID=2606599 RepID=UPI00131B7CEE|nr:NAD(P)-dependent oxidoreductase [Alteribacillus sp. YIM 98480]